MLGPAQLRAVVDACPDAFVALDTDHRIVHWSRGAERLLGWTGAEVLGRPDPTVPPELEAGTRTITRMLVAGHDPGTSWQVPRIDRDGRRVTLELTGWLPLGDGGFGVFFRAPDREAVERHLRNVLSADLAVATSGDDVVAAVDAALAGLAGATASLVLRACGCGGHLVTGPGVECRGGAVRPVVTHPAGAGSEGPRSIEHATLLHEADEEHVCLVPMGPAEADAWLAVAGIHDRAARRHALVTVRAVADEAWVALQRAELIVALQGRVHALESLDASRSDAIAGVTHDLKAPIHVLGGFLETLRARPPTGEDRDRAFDAMERQVTRISRMVDDLLLASRSAYGPVRPASTAPVDLGEVARSIVEAADPAARGRIEVRTASDLLVAGDGDQLGRVVANLVDNACKYGGDGPVVVEVARDDDHAVLTVTDHGPGLDADERDRVFGRFVVGRAGANRGSTGLGLHVAREIARGHGGELRALAPVGEHVGAVFELRLPVAGPQAAAD